MFRLESDLHNRLLHENWSEDGSYEKIVIRSKMPISECIPDIVITKLNPPYSRIETKKKLTYKHTYVLWLLRKFGSLNIDDISAYFFEPNERIIKYVDDLLTMNFIHQNRSTNYSLNKIYSKSHSEISAIEIKIRKWKDALNQAKRYLLFADKVSVILDASRVKITDQIENSFQVDGIGLFIANENSLEMIVQPIIRRTNLSPEREYILFTALFSLN
jgi:hypothetical protein